MADSQQRAELHRPDQENASVPAFRLEPEVHDLLRPVPSTELPVLQPSEGPGLPDAVYPCQPDRIMTRKEYHRHQAGRTARTWGAPFAKSLWHRGELRPIISYLFTEYACNLDCHYCWSYDNAAPGMTEAVARRSIDWMEGTGCRVLALMGGEPLLRTDFMHKVVYYAAKKGFFVYIATNGRRLKPEVTDRLGDAGLSAINLAIDTVKFRPELPKSLDKIRSYFDYMVENQHRYGYLMLLNMNITRINMDDVKELTEIARDNGIGTDYHINESPLMSQDHFKHLDENSTYLTPDDWPRVDALLDYLADKHRAGYKMPNPANHFPVMKRFMRGEEVSWTCRAGQNSLIVRCDGSLAPCFPMYGSTYDWGTVGNHKFEVSQLDEMKQSCNKRCLSTLNYILGHCYSVRRVLVWTLKQTLRGYKGASGSL